MRLLALRVIGIVSVGLTAIALVSATYHVVAQPCVPVAPSEGVLRELEVGIGPAALGTQPGSTLVEQPEEQPERDDVGEPDDGAMRQQLRAAETSGVAAAECDEQYDDGERIRG